MYVPYRKIFHGHFLLPSFNTTHDHLSRCLSELYTYTDGITSLNKEARPGNEK